ncbi:hypothetical protein [Clostridium felsineum]|uniref:hypothetical protein n=1 Tax=Clostridium felsineum TaxID=36839 RepID=UPI00111565F2|nr:hypothetical protein [Clostridium felsineum]
MATTAVDLDFVDSVNWTLNDCLVYPETLPKGLTDLRGKAQKLHNHIGQYLPLQNGTLEGLTRLITPNMFYSKQENNYSWKIGRLSTSTSSSHLAPELAFIPSSDYYTPGSGGNNGETWDTTKAIIFKPDGTVYLNTNKVLANNQSDAVTLNGAVTLAGTNTLSGSTAVTADFETRGMSRTKGHSLYNNTGTGSKFLCVCRIYLPQQYTHSVVKLNIHTTGSYPTAGYVVMKYTNNTSATAVDASGKTRYFVEIDSASGNTIFSAIPIAVSGGVCVELWAECKDYAQFLYSVPYWYIQNGGTLTVNPDSGAVLGALPTAGSNRVINSQTFTYGTAVSATVKDLTL